MSKRMWIVPIAALVMGFCSFVFAGKLGTVVPWQDNELPHQSKVHEQTITTDRAEYQIKMGGNVDLDHAETREYGNFHVGWQPNESLTIENLGNTPVKNAKVIINGQRDWYTIDSMLAEAIRNAKTDQDKIYMIWDFVRANRHHDSPLFVDQWQDEIHDPMKYLCMYGEGLCDDSGRNGSALYDQAGFTNPKPVVRSMHGHVMCEVFCNGRWQFMDIDENAFYLDRENELPVGGDEIAKDHDLAAREFCYGPKFGSWESGYGAASLLGRDDGRRESITKGYQIRVDLRPGERIEYRWDNIGKWAMCTSDRELRYVGNSRLIYEPAFSDSACEAKEVRDLESADHNGKSVLVLPPGKRQGNVVYEMKSAFVFCGGHINAEFELHHPTDRVVIEVWAVDNKGVGKTEPVAVWQAGGVGTKTADVEIDEAIRATLDGPVYAFWVCAKLLSPGGKGTARLTDMSIRGDIMVSPHFLPRLRLGDNQVVYTDDSGDARKVKVTHRWRETTAVTLPAAPKLLYPQSGATNRDSVVTYKWQPENDASAYHLQVFRDPQLKYPYRSSLDVMLEKVNQFEVPFDGIYSPDTTYYWRMRSQNDKGIWGDWSDVAEFTWSGPRVPVDVKLAKKNGTITLTWQPNPRGEKPVAYEIYGCDIKGFSIHKQPYIMVKDIAEQPANYLGQTTDTKMIVGGYQAADQTPAGVEANENLNRCYYRVVAIDEHGTRSGCSDYAEMDHPYIWSKPVENVSIGQPYRYESKVIHDMGDLQYYYEKQKGFWDREHLTFNLAEGPAWLTVDPKSGVLTGIPADSDVGEHQVVLQVTATFDKRTGEDQHTKDLPDRHANQTFSIAVK